MNEQLFDSGQSLVWREVAGRGNREIQRNFQRKFGNGPFEVLRVVQMTLAEANVWEHEQWVHLHVSGMQRRFSGFWFQRKE